MPKTAACRGMQDLIVRIEGSTAASCRIDSTPGKGKAQLQGSQPTEQTTMAQFPYMSSCMHAPPVHQERLCDALGVVRNPEGECGLLGKAMLLRDAAGGRGRGDLLHTGKPHAVLGSLPSHQELHAFLSAVRPVGPPWGPGRLAWCGCKTGRGRRRRGSRPPAAQSTPRRTQRGTRSAVERGSHNLGELGAPANCPRALHESLRDQGA